MRKELVSISELKEVVETSTSMAEAASKLNLHYNTFIRYAKKYDLYRPNQGRKGISRNHKNNSNIDVYEILDGKHPHFQSYKLKHKLFEAGIKENRCEKCNIEEWNGEPLNCELDHIDGNRTNHSLNNLKILCPNCHAQTPTFRYKRGAPCRTRTGTR